MAFASSKPCYAPLPRGQSRVIAHAIQQFTTNECRNYFAAAGNDACLIGKRSSYLIFVRWSVSTEGSFDQMRGPKAHRMVQGAFILLSHLIASAGDETSSPASE